MAGILVYLYICLVYLMTLTSGVLESVDVLKPIVKISPARNTGTTDDSFGYSVTAHQLFTNSTGMSLQDILNNTFIMVGAPNGRYPGGLYPNTDTPLSREACSLLYNQSEIDTFNDSQVIDLCYKNRTGLVYQCPLSVGTCSAALGNGSSTRPDGLLFDRVGNVRVFAHDISEISNDLFPNAQNKNGQQMGATVYSAGDVFVACAPMWEYTRSNNAQPRGHCVYSGRSLKDSIVVQPCIQGGASTHQSREGFCEGGFSVDVSLTNATANDNSVMTGKNILLTGVPGRHFSTGGAFFYTNVGTNMITLDKSAYIQVPSVPASIGANDSIPYRHFYTVNNEEYSYYGYSIASGFLTSQITKDFLITSPRYTSFTQIGRVYIVNVIDQLPTMHVDGEQFGEYFGHSVAVADLNGDGWDDFIVGAPIYSEHFRNEIGRIFVYWNNKGNSFNRSAVITGTRINGRFGIAITSLGDINNDGFDDIAVSAPFEGSGVVYIYHGQQMDEQGSIINTTIQQHIDGADVVKQVTNLTSVSSFGYSISGSVDVDQNQYRDLVIGAFESQAVFVLRSRPVAIASISLNITVKKIELNTFACKHNGLSVNCFDVEVCTQYYGKGLESGFSTIYQLKEIVQSNQAPRLFFTNDSSLNSVIRNVNYNGINILFCENVIVFIQNSSDVSNFKLSAELQQLQQDSEPVDTNFVITGDLLPVIDSTPSQIELIVARRCGIDNLCRPDIVLKHINTTYIDLNGNPLSSNRLVIGEADIVRIYFEYFNNITEDAYNTYLTFTIQKQYFQTPQIRPRSVVSFECNDTTRDNTTHSVYVCPIVNRIAFEDGTRQLYLNLLLRRNILIGNEGSLIVPMSIITPISSFSNESITSNNHIFSLIPVVAEAMYKIQVSSISAQYQGNLTSNSFGNDPDSFLGNKYTTTVTLNNNGPSQIIGATLTISIPSFSTETGDYYYFYPSEFEVRNQIITCDSSKLNPQNYALSSSGRRKRGIVYLRTAKRQKGSADSVSLDCSEPSQLGCINLVCYLTSYASGSTTLITVSGYVDERFYSGKKREFSLKIGVKFNITDGITHPINSTSTISNTITLRYFTESVITAQFPWYVAVGPVVAAVIFLVVLFLILYFLGFFKRRKNKKETAGGAGTEDFEQFDENPFGNTDSQPAAKEKEAEGTIPEL